MTLLRAVFPFRIGGLFVHRDTLGMRFAIERAGRTVEISFPAHQDDFRTWQLFEREEYQAYGRPSAGTTDDPEQAVSVYVVQVTLEFEGDFDPSRLDLDSAERTEPLKKALETFASARDIAEEVLREFIAWVRAADRQSWLGLSTGPLELAGPASLLDVQRGERIPIGLPLHLHSHGLPLERGLMPDGLSALAERVASNQGAPVAETLLSDAEYLAWGDYASRDPVRALLIAAIACEVKVKTNLRERIDSSRADLLEFILDNPREITLTAADGLFNKLMKVAQSRSLRDDDRDLFREVVRLFEVRNDVAHGGEMPPGVDAGQLVRAARRAFSWIDAEPPRRE